MTLEVKSLLYNVTAQVVRSQLYNVTTQVVRSLL